MKHRRYNYTDRPAELDVPFENKPVLNQYRVVCRRRTTAGRMTLEDVRANTPEEAMQLVREGKAQKGIGLGWIPMTATLVPSGS